MFDAVEPPDSMASNRTVRCLHTNGNPFIQHKSKKERLMKTTLHYIIAILLFSLNAVHTFAAGDGLPFTITGNGYYEYNADNTLLTIHQSDDITIVGTRVTIGEVKVGATVRKVAVR